MKKLSIILLACLFCSCSHKKDEKTPEIKGYNYEKVVNEDRMIYRGCNFYGSTIEFDTNFILDSARVIKIIDLFEKDGECIQINHLPDGTIVVSQIDYLIPRNSPMNYDDSVGISLRGVIDIIKSDSLCYWIDSKTVSLCQPKRGSSIYVIGNGLLMINAQTGEIKR